MLGGFGFASSPGWTELFDLDRHAAAEFEHAGADHFVALLEAGDNRNLIAAGRAEFHELLLDLIVFSR